MKKQVLIGVGAVLAAVVVVIVLAAGFLSGSGSFYYTQIDNSKLTEGAFLQLTVSPIRGVVEWSELTYEELPVKVQERYDALGIE